MNFTGKTSEETSEDKKTHCCYKKVSEKTKGEEEATEEDDIKQLSKEIGEMWNKDIW